MGKLTWWLAIASSAVLIGSFSHAHDLGVIGPSYAIRERDLLDVIQERLAQHLHDGRLDEHRRQLAERSRRYLTRPAGIRLPRTQTYRSRAVSLEFVTTEAIIDGRGQILYPVGTRVNPLVFQPLTTTLCFADGDDSDQVAWLKDSCRDPGTHKRILVRGDYPAIAAQLDGRLYFDQRGSLVQRFGIQAVPAIVQQKEASLYVEEMPLR